MVPPPRDRSSYSVTCCTVCYDGYWIFTDLCIKSSYGTLEGFASALPHSSSFQHFF